MCSGRDVGFGYFVALHSITSYKLNNSSIAIYYQPKRWGKTPSGAMVEGRYTNIFYKHKNTAKLE